VENRQPTAKPATHPLDAMAVAPDHHRVLFENDIVRVLHTELQPGEQTPVHAHEWPASLYVLAWSDFVRYDPEGRVLMDSRQGTARPEPGTAIWGAPLPAHSVSNVGTAPLRIIAVEVKVREA
jgi:quercetin dioxygenase-like cupin family protein